jgi:hypothetical protein
MDRHTFVDAPPWRGTAVGIDVSVDQETEFAQLLAAIGKAYSKDVKKRRKAYYKQIRFQR